MYQEYIRLSHITEEMANLNKVNLNHIAFGVFLGYPDKAIIETVRFW